MGLFDKVFSSTPTKVTYSPKNEQEACIGIMYACLATDGDVSDIEIEKLTSMIGFKQNFQGHDIVASYKTAMVTHKQVGSKAIIDSSVSKVSADNKPTLFAMIMELLLADGILADKEKEIAEYLSTSLQLDSNTAQKIIEVMLIKNKDNMVIVG